MSLLTCKIDFLDPWIEACIHPSYISSFVFSPLSHPWQGLFASQFSFWLAYSTISVIMLFTPSSKLIQMRDTIKLRSEPLFSFLLPYFLFLPLLHSFLPALFQKVARLLSRALYYKTPKMTHIQISSFPESHATSMNPTKVLASHTLFLSCLQDTVRGNPP